MNASIHSAQLLPLCLLLHYGIVAVIYWQNCYPQAEQTCWYTEGTHQHSFSAQVLVGVLWLQNAVTEWRNPRLWLCGCVAVCVYIAGLLADNVSDIYNVQCGQQIIPLKLISCSNWPLFYQLEPQQLGARGEKRIEDRIISDDVKTKAETGLLYDVMMESEL